eukprot:CAMPEP_0180218864 /NCGR_PEP_ID=MMETSP0987-20121128/18016_1 /TAXON_ID=697907 /ORGANISM="non described non described, Strain CCMP2293" /LENGTH=743 /DNA_ID=CAMNT_0022179137 /DNA_START=40 /DNA_END=2271 /DNA_ORIENTATION=-
MRSSREALLALALALLATSALSFQVPARAIAGLRLDGRARVLASQGAPRGTPRVARLAAKSVRGARILQCAADAADADLWEDAYEVLNVADFGLEKAKRLLAQGKVATARRGALLVEEGKDVTIPSKEHRVFMILSGTVSKSLGGNKLMTLQRGDFVGESRFLEVQALEKLRAEGKKTPQSPEELDSESLRAAFAKFDADADGRISSAELSPILKSLGGNLSEEQGWELVRSLDVNHDGMMDLQEFSGALRRLQDGVLGRFGNALGLFEAVAFATRKESQVSVVAESDVGYVTWTIKELEGAFKKDPIAAGKMQAIWAGKLAAKLTEATNYIGGGGTRGGKERQSPSVKPGDYGFPSSFLWGSRGDFGPLDAAVPGGAIQMSLWQFGREYEAMRGAFRGGELWRVMDALTGSDALARKTEVPGFVAAPLLVLGKAVSFIEGFLQGKLKPLSAEDIAPEELAEQKRLQGMVLQLQLSNKAVNTREDVREEQLRIALEKARKEDASAEQKELVRGVESTQGGVVIRVPYKMLCWLIDTLFVDRPIQRFWFLENVARMPYLSYNTMLALYEVLGWWRVSSDARRVHFAEEWNEVQHLKILEALGGDSSWVDRFLGRHAALFYLVIMNHIWLLSPSFAYNFSELIEFHALDTYGEFVDANEELLRRLPPPQEALDYFCSPDMYIFDEFQTGREPRTRRPKIESLYDVFCNIRDDELEHVKTMYQCQTNASPIVSPNAVAANNAMKKS